jgi:ubiquitin C-terminal hydrolase
MLVKLGFFFNYYDIFFIKGTYQSTTTCTQCMYISRSLEPFVCLTLPIPLTNQCTLEDCLAYLNEEEYLIDDSRWFCMSKIE